MEVIVLAGGLGTRLQGVIGASPKCMAPVNGQPFLAYLLDYVDKQGATRVILSLGYKHKMVIDWLEDQELYFELDYVVEDEPLGTGGGILAAMEQAETDYVAVVNGDTMFRVNLKEQMKFHIASESATTLALKEMHKFDRYGIVETDNKGIIKAFKEKQAVESGLINGGVYIIDRERFLARNLPDKFSFEKDYLEKFVGEKKFYGYKNDGYFIDIGIPNDYAKAQEDFKSFKL